MGIDEIERFFDTSIFARLEEAQRSRSIPVNMGGTYLRLNLGSVKGLIEPEVRALARERQGRLHTRYGLRKGTKSDNVLSEF